MTGRIRQVPGWLLICALAFGAALILLVGASLRRPSPGSFAPSATGPHPVGDSLVRGRTYTLDARDPRTWAFFDFSRGSAVQAPGPVEWDLAVRRHRIIVNGGESFAGAAGVRVLGNIALDSIRRAPEDGYRGTLGALDRRARQPGLDGWYRYHFLSHLLGPRPRTYALRTADGRYAVLRILSYYCPAAQAGCLTFRYTYQGDGTPRLVP
ncbi:MAG: HmuY family protein [Gemmatimonadota bacterium]